jgi:hypothetical protein
MTASEPTGSAAPLAYCIPSQLKRRTASERLISFDGGIGFKTFFSARRENG